MPFKSGDIVKNLVPVYGEVMPYDPQRTNQTPTVNPGKSGPPGARHNEIVEIPAGHTGEIMSSGDFETVVMYPIHSTGPLEPHLIKVESFTSDFAIATRKNPFKLDRSDYEDPGKSIEAGLLSLRNKSRPMFNTVYEKVPQYRIEREGVEEIADGKKRITLTAFLGRKPAGEISYIYDYSSGRPTLEIEEVETSPKFRNRAKEISDAFFRFIKGQNDGLEIVKRASEDELSWREYGN